MESPLSPEQDVALSVAESLKRGLRNGNQDDYDWLFTEDFEEWCDAWADAAQLTEEVDPDIIRQKLIVTCWKPRRSRALE